MVRFYQEVSTPVQGVCYSLKRFGGRWFAAYQVLFAVFVFVLSTTVVRSLLVFFSADQFFLPFLLFLSTTLVLSLLVFFAFFVCLLSTWEYFRRLMATSLFAWTPIHQQTALSTLLESGSDIPEESNLDVEQKDIHASIHPSMHHLYRDRDIFCRSERI